MYISIKTFKSEDGYGAMVETGPYAFTALSAFGDTELEAIKEFCVALIGAIEVEMEDNE